MFQKGTGAMGFGILLAIQQGTGLDVWPGAFIGVDTVVHTDPHTHTHTPTPLPTARLNVCTEFSSPVVAGAWRCSGIQGRSGACRFIYSS